MSCSNYSGVRETLALGGATIVASTTLGQQSCSAVTTVTNCMISLLYYEHDCNYCMFETIKLQLTKHTISLALTLIAQVVLCSIVSYFTVQKGTENIEKIRSTQ